jgi:hypothetical protein
MTGPRGRLQVPSSPRPGRSSADRAPVFGTGCRGFESLRPGHPSLADDSPCRACPGQRPRRQPGGARRQRRTGLAKRRDGGDVHQSPPGRIRSCRAAREVHGVLGCPKPAHRLIADPPPTVDRQRSRPPLGGQAQGGHQDEHRPGRDERRRRRPPGLVPPATTGHAIGQGPFGRLAEHGSEPCPGHDRPAVLPLAQQPPVGQVEGGCEGTGTSGRLDPALPGGVQGLCKVRRDRRRLHPDPAPVGLEPGRLTEFSTEGRKRHVQAVGRHRPGPQVGAESRPRDPSPSIERETAEKPRRRIGKAAAGPEPDFAEEQDAHRGSRVPPRGQTPVYIMGPVSCATGRRVYR